MESKASVFKNILISAQICLIMFQLTMLAYFSSNSYLGESFCVALVFFITLFVFCLMNQEIFEPDKISDLKMVDWATSNLVLSSEVIEEWGNIYNHPLLLNSLSGW